MSPPDGGRSKFYHRMHLLTILKGGLTEANLLTLNTVRGKNTRSSEHAILRQKSLLTEISVLKGFVEKKNVCVYNVCSGALC